MIQMNSMSAIDYIYPYEKINKLSKLGKFKSIILDINDYDLFEKYIKTYKPEVIVNLAHNPSAPFSMKTREISNYVLYNNIIGINNLL